MSEGIFDRTKLLLGTENFQKIETKNILVFGVGGVGGFAAEALVRSGIHHLTIVDNDTVNITNINRQIIATTKTVGQSKVLAMKNRLLEINPQAQIEARQMFFLPENSSEIDFTKFDYVIDAIDTVKAKVQIVQDVSYTVFNNPDNAALSFVESAAAGFVMFTGIKVTLGMDAFR